MPEVWFLRSLSAGAGWSDLLYDVGVAFGALILGMVLYVSMVRSRSCKLSRLSVPLSAAFAPALSAARGVRRARGQRCFEQGGATRAPRAAARRATHATRAVSNSYWSCGVHERIACAVAGS